MRRLSFGQYPDLSLAEANVLHAKAYSLRQRGIDPALEKQKLLEQERGAETVAELAHEYMERHAKKNKKSWESDQRLLDKDVLPAWGSLRARDICRRDVIKLMDRIMDRNAPYAANRTLQVVRKMFNVGIERSIVDSNPCALIKKPGKEEQRQRVLNPDEIQILWGELDGMKCHPNIPLVLKLILVTGQRRVEVAEASWKEFHMGSRWWTIPEKRSKNGLQHRVYISHKAKKLLDQIKQNEPYADFLLPSPRARGMISMDANAVTRAVNSNRKVFSIKNWSAHDLRRSAASCMTAMGTSRLVVGKILNHVEGGVTRVYDRHGYDQEKQVALEGWSKKLQSIIAGEQQSNVVNFG